MSRTRGQGTSIPLNRYCRGCRRNFCFHNFHLYPKGRNTPPSIFLLPTGFVKRRTFHSIISYFNGHFILYYIYIIVLRVGIRHPHKANSISVFPGDHPSEYLRNTDTINTPWFWYFHTNYYWQWFLKWKLKTILKDRRLPWYFVIVPGFLYFPIV